MKALITKTIPTIQTKKGGETFPLPESMKQSSSFHVSFYVSSFTSGIAAGNSIRRTTGSQNEMKFVYVRVQIYTTTYSRYHGGRGRGAGGRSNNILNRPSLFKKPAVNISTASTDFIDLECIQRIVLRLIDI